jgi:hypothetical protein
MSQPTTLLKPPSLSRLKVRLMDIAELALWVKQDSPG